MKVYISLSLFLFHIGFTVYLYILDSFFWLNYKTKTLTYNIYNMLASQNALASIIEN